MPGYTKMRLDLKSLPNWLTFLKEDLNLKALGVSVARLPAGKGYTIMHQHEEQEEVYMVLSGRGIIHIDGEDISLQEGDFINVVPESKRALKAADNSDLIFICAGAVSTGKYPKSTKSRALIDDGIPDYDNVPPWYEGNKKIAEINKRLKHERKARKE
jgi:mannose-6-phosphate isomerase-like protein (cupin superfamily)